MLESKSVPHTACAPLLVSSIGQVNDNARQKRSFTMRILIVDDERQLANSLKDYFALDGIEADIAFDGTEGQKKLEDYPYDALVTDLRMPGIDGNRLLKWMKEEGPNIPAIVMSAHGEVDDAVTSMKLGAYDYLVKPFDPDELSIRIKKAVQGSRMIAALKVGMNPVTGRKGFIGESPLMIDILKVLERAAPSTATILLTGESGTGKEVAAKFVHEHSKRDGPFVAVNMGAFPENLLESELFGYEKGAFTGADSRKQGLFESAHGGTLFLDEIGELPMHLQVKLLRVIQDRKVMRLGSLKGVPIDIRIIAATNRNLEVEVKAGRFREDLFYRINVIRVHLPPLRERKQDIPTLSGAFLARFSVETGRKFEGISNEAMEILLGYPFPGNVRELENAIERAVIMADDALLSKRDFAFLDKGKSAENQLKIEETSSPISDDNRNMGNKTMTLAQLEKETIITALERNSGHREKTAQELGITRRTLLNKMNEYDLSFSGHA
jgi:two-component system response regulator AtoC